MILGLELVIHFLMPKVKIYGFFSSVSSDAAVQLFDRFNPPDPIRQGFAAIMKPARCTQ
jgi:hypothetical protein